MAALLCFGSLTIRFSPPPIDSAAPRCRCLTLLLHPLHACPWLFLSRRVHTALRPTGMASAGVWAQIGPWNAVPSGFLRGEAAAPGFAIINSHGALGGAIGPYLIGVLSQAVRRAARVH